ncbi:conserved hypothetical protein [Talaromyces stipitatus ATCC 10500]|uniref:Prion-inhibition and propagation HeLo domain-containing protein n=1 Tax=Talaromyces stipitatus (strain ATCC 10500 / CBS 375.48 / QM 6759 / NRRL 1006) TaxID=441959 RepID=B8M3S0_TALSN|nr:uncharacterized protein TSTA_038680 [Talaromyces stipitatus ATCC 10500]EED20663.1 conserved hypothetical protein [Talaromyces stipitatus ATCC 10500]
MTLCKLEAAEMRLTRWGAALGIDGPDAKLVIEGDSDEEKVNKAYHWLNEIKRAFDSAMETSLRFTTTAKPEKLQLLENGEQIRKGSNALQKLHEKMRNISDERVKPRKRDRVSWALYRKGNYENLVENISMLTSKLVELFPSAVDAQKRLCQGEIREIEPESLDLLGNAIGEEDEIFKQAVKVELAKGPNLFTNIAVTDHFRGHFGNNIAAGEASAARAAGGNAVAHFGSNIGKYKGKTVFDTSQ